MEWVNSSYGIPIKSWCKDLDDKTFAQAVALANHPVTFSHMALMADAHLGYGMCIGGVIACDKAIIPYAVGSDIACGVIAVRTSYLAAEITREQIKQIMNGVLKGVPMGLGVEHDTDQAWEGFKHPTASTLEVVSRNLQKARRQLGTLGSGNHYWELQAGDDGYIWLQLHSGSRKLGYNIADHYHKEAVKLCTRWFSNVPNMDLAFLPIDDPMAKEYKAAMDFAMLYAQASRQQMMARSKDVVHDVLGCEFPDEHDVVHNYARWENHYGKDVIVHRKGATSAKLGEVGVIPGSMGTASYIVKGLGNRDSFCSCSHGAGRAMGRNAFNKTTSEAACNKSMAGVEHNGWSETRKGKIDLSEAPGAYKDIEQVMEAQADLVTPVVKLIPLANLKG